MNEKIEYNSLSPAISNIKGWINECKTEIIKKEFDKLLEESKFNVLSYSEHFFPVCGFTAFWLLAESHLAVHSFPENNCTYIELSSCNHNKFINFLSLCEKSNFKFTWEEKELKQFKY